MQKPQLVNGTIISFNRLIWKASFVHILSTKVQNSAEVFQWCQVNDKIRHIVLGYTYPRLFRKLHMGIFALHLTTIFG